MEELGKNVLFWLAWEAIQHQTTLFVLRDGRTFPFDMDHTYKEWRFTRSSLEGLKMSRKARGWDWSIPLAMVYEGFDIAFDTATRFDRVAMESGDVLVFLYIEGEE